MVLAPDAYAIPAGSLVLVTGANGYIGSHVADVLLGLGFRVRGTVRSAAPWLDGHFAPYGRGRFESVVVPDLGSAGDLDAALAGVAAVAHVANDVSFSHDVGVIAASARHVEAVLAAAGRAPTVRRFVLTSSSASAGQVRLGASGITVDTGSWNDEAVALAATAPSWTDPATGAATGAATVPEAARGFMVYSAAKTVAERAAWAWVDAHKPAFVLNTVLPNMNWGKILVPDHQFASSMGMVRKIFQGDFSVQQVVTPQHWIDVVDCARLHAVGLIDPSVQNERIFAYGNPFNWTGVLAALRRLRPNATLPDAPPDEPEDLRTIAPTPRALALLRAVFGQEDWTGLDESLAAGLIGIE